MELESDEEDKPENGENGADEKEEKSHIMEELWVEGVKLPPEPQGNCSKELQVLKPFSSISILVSVF